MPHGLPQTSNWPDAAVTQAAAEASRHVTIGRRVMRPPGSQTWTYVLLLGDLSTLGVAFILGFFVAGSLDELMRRPWLSAADDVAARLRSFTPVALIVVGWLNRRGHYTYRQSLPGTAADFAGAALFGLLLDGFLQYAMHQTQSRLWCLCVWLMVPGLLRGSRLLVRMVLGRAGFWRRRVMLAGDAVAARAVQAALLADRSMGYEIAGRVSLSDPALIGGSPAVLLRGYAAGLLVLAPEAAPYLPPPALVATLVRERVAFAMMPPDGDLVPAGYHVQRFAGHDRALLTYRNRTEQPLARCCKLAFDVTAALLLLAAASPAMLLIAAMISADGGPVFYAQLRLGRGGLPFRCLKFRSMAVRSEQILAATLQRDPRAAAEWAVLHKLKRDPRVTPIGRWLRRTSLDELPQLLNVLRLEMSLVGPRPILPAESSRYGDDIAYYGCVRPGLTGLWQISGRSETSYRRKVHLDSWYVKNWTFARDLVILLRTIPSVLLRQGAF